MTQFPAALDTFQNPNATTTMDAAGYEHDVQHANLNDAVRAIEQVIGVTASGDTNSLQYKLAAVMALVMNPNATFRIKDGQMQIWDIGYQKYVPLISNNGVLATGAPVD